MVRDKRGKPVRNLKAADLEIFEDGVRQEIRSFRAIGGREIEQQRSAMTPTTVPPGRARCGP